MIRAFFLLFSLLLAVSAQARPAVCGGKDLLGALKARDRAAFARVETETSATPHARGLLWKIEKPGVAPSYLFGTAHVTDRDAIAKTARLAPHLPKASVLALELTREELDANAALLMSRLIDGSLTTVSDLKDEAAKTKLAEALKDYGVPLEAAEAMNPWLLAIILAIPPCEMARAGAKLPTVEQELETIAKRHAVPVLGLETPGEQIEAFLSMPRETAAKSMVEMATLGKEMRENLFATLIAAYRAEDVQAYVIGATTGALTPGQPLSGWQDMQLMMLDKRNVKMVERARPLIDKGGAAIAVGALHLPGEKGLITLLKAAGYQVTALPAADKRKAPR